MSTQEEIFAKRDEWLTSPPPEQKHLCEYCEENETDDDWCGVYICEECNEKQVEQRARKGDIL